jgi:hypothetical protein
MNMFVIEARQCDILELSSIFIRIDIVKKYVYFYIH